MICQALVGGTFVYSSYKVGNSIRNVDEKYFSQYSLEAIKNFRGNMWNHQQQPPPVGSVGPVLANMNRQPYGGNQQYYQQNQPIFAQPQNNQMVVQDNAAGNVQNSESGQKESGEEE